MFLNKHTNVTLYNMQPAERQAKYAVIALNYLYCQCECSKVIIYLK